ncbi:MAG: hypothetical protein E6Z15_09080 [Paenibacillus macerans]|nr:hypothetical protein [Paenibacillus macerans]
MSQFPCPDWLKPAFKQRFDELAFAAGEYQINKEVRRNQETFMKRLRGELSEEQLKLLLEWDEAANYRNAIEKEQMYYAGIKDGILISKHFFGFMSADADKP